jgi:uncharacterized circularly permuted ATP-grasp superfamily protein/uncharacterized alpha-E superfamily protein
MQQRDPAAGLLAAYRPLPGVPDELIDAQGAIRPVWRTFIDAFAKLPPEDLRRRFARGNQYLRDAGVFFRHYGPGGSTERDWPLSHIPVLVQEAEWRQIADGLIQRAELLESVVADLYGPGRLIAEGRLPAALIAASREWLRPLVGITPRGGKFLHLLAFEIGRGPEGKWWVLGDRTQAPSGAGFAIENRIATSRVFPEIFSAANVHRLAGFFRSFRDTLDEMRAGGDSRVAILTPGPLNDTYFEHAYIARYLGLMLLEGEDLTVDNGRLMVRTVAGLEPVSVLWRRLDASYADPLELDERSRLGVPGLTGAIRSGDLSMVNALGTGVLELRAMMAFLPRLCQIVRDEPLALPNVATWWCGQAAERAHVLANRETMTIGAARSTMLAFEAGDDGLADQFTQDGHDPPAAEWLAQHGAELVGQETVRLSTTPAHVDGRLAARPMTLRVFLARTAAGWQVMPGGNARIGKSEDSSALGLQRGGSIADIWVIGDAPVDQETLIPATRHQAQRVKPHALPSRAAENLYWLGRYVERAEGIIRFVRAYHIRLSETANREGRLVAGLARHLAALGVEAADGRPAGLLEALASALNSAGNVRDRFSIDGWVALKDLEQTARGLPETMLDSDDAAQTMTTLLRKIAGFSGLVHENMHHSIGWRFLGIGRAVERTIIMAAALERFAAPDAPEGALDLAIEIGDNVITHRQRYAATSRASVIDLLALDGLNPQSVLYHLAEIREHVSFLPGSDEHGQLSDLSRAALELHTRVALKTPETLDTAALGQVRKATGALSDLLTAIYFG